jgi:hypothetical protein
MALLTLACGGDMAALVFVGISGEGTKATGFSLCVLCALLFQEGLEQEIAEGAEESMNDDC